MRRRAGPREKWSVLFIFVLARNHKLHYPVRDSDGIPTGTTLLTASIDSLVPIDLSLILEIMSAILESVRAFFFQKICQIGKRDWSTTQGIHRGLRIGRSRVFIRTHTNPNAQKRKSKYVNIRISGKQSIIDYEITEEYARHDMMQFRNAHGQNVGEKSE